MVESGTLIGGRYEVIDKIGTGGMSDVFKALDTSLGREVALKVLKDEYVTDIGFVSKFRAEAMAAAGLEHPNIVNIYDVGSEEGLYYIVMEYVEGITLKTYIAKKGQLSYNELLSIAIQVGRGIEAAHNKNIIHRDIKPQNVIISKEGKVKVTDFGIAKAITSNTINADRMGSVHYSSPEQARNGYVTFQSDIYSLGIVMYEMCTGRVPYDGDTTVAVAIQHLQTEMTPPSHLAPNVPVSVEKIILRATMKNPDRRYATMTEMLTDLKKALVNPSDDFVVIPPQSGAASAIQHPTAPIAGKEEPNDSVKSSDNTLKKEADKPKRKPKPRREEIEDDDDDDDDDDGVSSGLDKAVTVMGIVAAFVIIGIVVYIMVRIFGFLPFGLGEKIGLEDKTAVSSSSSLEEEIKVPKVIGLSETEAKKAIEEAGFVYKKAGESASETYEAGLVINQDTEGSAAKGTTISVTVSSGKGEIPIPNVVGYTRDQAKRNIEVMGFLCVIETEFSDDVEQGTVIRQDPVDSQMGNKGDRVTIYVSNGSEQMVVPDVTGSTQTEATNTLTRAGFQTTVVPENSEEVEAGKVIRQSPTDNAPAGSNITIYVSEGGVVYYRFTTTLTPVNGLPTYIVIRDTNGNTLYQEHIAETTEISLTNLTVSDGVIYYYSDTAMTGEVALSTPVYFQLQ